MIYVFDTNVITQILRSFSSVSFCNFWLRLTEAIAEERITSTREVLRELCGFHSIELRQWTIMQDKLFSPPTTAEAAFVTRIFEFPQFQNNLESKKLIYGGNNADAFLVARAKVLTGTVVTEESKPPHGARIPNICEHFGIPCTKLDGFMQQENWTF